MTANLFLPLPPAFPRRYVRAVALVAIAAVAFTLGLSATSHGVEKPEDEMPADKPAAAEKADGTFDGRVAAAWLALGKRDVAAAKTALADATVQASTAGQKEEIAQMQVLTISVDQFWREIDAEFKRLQPGDELDLNNTKAAVVEVKGDSLTLHVEGKSQKHSRATMPGSWALALADHRFDNSAANKRLLGAFLAVDPQGDRRRALQLWEKAQKGEPATGQLLSLMNHSNIPAGPSGKDVIGRDSGRGKGKGKSDTSKAGMSTSGDDETEKSMIPRAVELPSKDKLTAANKQLKEKYATEVRGAKAPERKLELSKTLVDAAAETDDEAWRLVLLRQALELTAGSGDLAALDDVIATMQQRFKIDAWEVNAEAFTRAATAAKPATITEVVRRALKLLDQYEGQEAAIKASHAKVAKKLDLAAVAAAHKAHDPELVKSVVGRDKRDN